MSIELAELSPALGAEVRGVQPGRPLPEATVREIHAAWDRHHLLLFRGQDWTPEQQLGLIRHFGDPLIETLDGSPFSYVSNVRSDATIRHGALFFHSDLAFTPTPLRAISLFAVDTPDGVAPTWFANAIRGCETLPAALRERLSGRTALHTFDLVGQRGDVRYRVADLPPDAPRASHPVLWRHPELGQPILYVNKMQTDRIEGLPEAESRALLEQLLDHLYRPEHIYEHRWQTGDLVFWDNWALQHARPDVPDSRTLRRVAIGERAVAVPVAGRSH
jgi:alpha-ketoglutarate-dependent taurine dioxygenase